MTEAVRPAITPGQLAQYRGCQAWNDCYFECCISAQETLDDPDESDQAEIEAAAAWVPTQRWT